MLEKTGIYTKILLDIYREGDTSSLHYVSTLPFTYEILEYYGGYLSLEIPY